MWQVCASHASDPPGGSDISPLSDSLSHTPSSAGIHGRGCTLHTNRGSMVTDRAIAPLSSAQSSAEMRTPGWESYHQESDQSPEETGCNLQHISDRENRCLAGTHGTSKRKYSSCSTIFLDDNTVSQPNLKYTIKCVAVAIYYHIKNRDTEGAMLLDIFDEKLHPLSKTEVPPDYDQIDTEQKQIYRFVGRCSVPLSSLQSIYLERLLTYAEIDITPGNWKRIILGAILLASKVWDDQAVWNVDYCQILKDITLERHFLELLQFNINVPSSVYAKYYFDLRSLSETNNLSFPLELLSRDKALKLEAISRLCDDRYKDVRKAARKRSSSTDNLCGIKWVPAILS
ncbi:hypothetical protein F7725_011062 [Dissostichus mawsoni]|uniref:Cyclin Y n=1 Tax=Dissostichus mawsoni TaxID=36200 RepID=A0A7J5Z9K6_DISMA|nr:hypothetical protein F7725_011062 [Dissostichus mawsoni]